MKIKVGKEKEFEQFAEKNSKDFYSRGIIDYAKRWAELMEKEIESGAKVADIADRTSATADTDGITGYMYGCAVSFLSNFWEYGEDLRKWHNHEYDYDGEGVVNPAILVIEGE
jgi:hypothetical protein